MLHLSQPLHSWIVLDRLILLMQGASSPDAGEMGSFQSARFEDVGTDYTPEKRPLNIFLLRLAFSNVYLCDGVLIDSGTILDFNSIRRAVEAFQGRLGLHHLVPWQRGA